jgi:hypothetical protein
MLTTRSKLRSASPLRFVASPSWNRRFVRPSSSRAVCPPRRGCGRCRRRARPRRAAPRHRGRAVAAAQVEHLHAARHAELADERLAARAHAVAMRVKSPFSHKAWFGFTSRPAPSVVVRCVRFGGVVDAQRRVRARRRSAGGESRERSRPAERLRQGSTNDRVGSRAGSFRRYRARVRVVDARAGARQLAAWSACRRDRIEAEGPWASCSSAGRATCACSNCTRVRWSPSRNPCRSTRPWRGSRPARRGVCTGGGVALSNALDLRLGF